MYHIVRNNTSKALSVQINGDVNFNFGGDKTINERIKGALVKKLGPSPRKKEVNPQTCRWLGEIPNFVSWNSDDTKIPGLLWICGGPGKGKTHLATHLVSQLRKSDMVLSYFCDARDILRSTEFAVVLGLLNQLLELENPEELYMIISDKFSGIEHDLFSDTYTADLWDCLEKMIRKRAQNCQVYVVLDGLDECDSASRSYLTTHLRKICNENRQEDKNRVKIVIFSRPSDLHHQADLIIDLDEDEILKWTEEDIRAIIKERCLLEQGEREFCDILTKRANGTFLWVALAISILDDRTAQKKIIDGDSAFLDKLLPIGLDAMYTMMLFNILDRVHRKPQCKEMIVIFRCLAIAFHPLTKEEVGAITALDGLVVDDALQAFQHILSITGKGSANEAVELIHSSLKELLVQDLSSLIPEKICWSAWPTLSSTASWLRENRLQSWLLDYAILVTMFAYSQWLQYQHRILIFGFLFCLLQLASQRQKSPLLIGLFCKAFEQWINKTIMIIFCVRENEVHRLMFESCIALMDDQENGLRRGMCGTEDPGPLESKMKAEEQFHLLRYPSRYWVRHLERSYPRAYEIDTMYVFLRKHFLHWLEAMSIFGVISEAAGELKTVRGILQHENGIEVSEFLYDAWRFVLKTSHIAETAPLQIYYSGLVFAPMKSIIRRSFGTEIHRIFTLPEIEESWNVELQTLEGHSDLVTSVAFFPGGQIASGSRDRTVRLWDTITGKERQVLEGHSRWVTSVAVSPDGQIVSASSEKTITLWDVTTEKVKHVLEGHSDSVTSVAFSLDGQIASASLDKTVRLWDVRTGKERHMLKGHSNPVESVAFSPNGHILASASHDKTIRLWDARTGKERHVLRGHSDWITSVCFSPNGQMASASHDKTIRLWDVITGKERHILNGHSSPVESVAFSPTGEILASTSDDKTIRLWDAMKGKERDILTDHCGRAQSVAFSPNGQILALASDDKTIRLWDVTKCKERQAIKDRSSHIESVALSPNGQRLVLSLEDEPTRPWNSAITDKKRQLFNGHSDRVLSVAFSPDGQILASASEDNTIRLWDAITGKGRQVLNGHCGWVISVAFSPNGQILASASEDRTIRLWDVTTGNERQVLSDHCGWIGSVAFSPDGQTFLALSPKGETVRRWDAKTGKERRDFYGYSGWVGSMGSSPYGSVSDGETIKVKWDAITGKERQMFEGHPGYFPEGHHQISLANDFVAFRGENILWLPMEYRRYSCSAFHKGSLAFGYDDGRVLIMGFSTSIE